MSLNKISNKKIFSAFIVVVVLFVVGLGLQAFFPPFNIEIIKYPFNLELSILLIITLFIICFSFSRSRIVVFLSSTHSAISAITFIFILTIVLGLTNQANAINDIPFKLGIRHMTSYYPFVISYLYLIITLVFATAKRVKSKFSIKNIAFILNHGGLLVLLLAMGFGAADNLDMKVNILEGETINSAMQKNGKKYKLPFSVELIDFKIENYMPKVAIIDNKTGKFLPENNPILIDIDSISKKISLLSYNFSVEEYIHNAKPKNKEYIRGNYSYPPAIKLNFEGASFWVTCGNNKVPYRIMSLRDGNAIVMLEPEPKSFSSDLIVTKDNRVIEQNISVNKPLKVDSWTLYQSSFDKKAGANSSISGLQLTYDPWQNLIFIGMLMLVIGAISLFWKL